MSLNYGLLIHFLEIFRFCYAEHWLKHQAFYVWCELKYIMHLKWLNLCDFLKNRTIEFRTNVLQLFTKIAKNRASFYLICIDTDKFRPTDNVFHAAHLEYNQTLLACIGDVTQTKNFPSSVLTIKRFDLIFWLFLTIVGYTSNHLAHFPCL